MNGEQIKKRRIVHSFAAAISGFLYTIGTQKNFQIQILIGLVAAFYAWLFGFTRWEWIVLLIVTSLVLAAEMVNTVIEVVVDLAVKEQLVEQARIAKDVSAAAVLLTSIFALLVGLILFIPHFGL